MIIVDEYGEHELPSFEECRRIQELANRRIAGEKTPQGAVAKEGGNSSGRPICLTSESGRFYLDGVGIVQRFEPSGDNPLMDECDGICSHVIDTLIVPGGVRGFCDEFLRSVHVKSRFELPDGLASIGGTTAFPGCVFADCDLPLVVIPEGVCEIGTFAFGNARIETLQMPLVLCEYARQFKEARIGTLRLPNALRGAFHLRGFNLGMCGESPIDAAMELGWLDSMRCNGTQIGKLEFY